MATGKEPLTTELEELIAIRKAVLTLADRMTAVETQLAALVLALE